MKKNSFKIVLLLSCVFELSCITAPFSERLSEAAISIINKDIVYDAVYTKIPYPNGDVQADKGVCSDVIIRAYRKVGVDLQKEVHEDMKQNFNLYPGKWGLKNTDTNIDHRRVPNLMVFFTRKGKKLQNSNNPEDYKPGDIVCWNLEGNLTHIGLVVNKKSMDKKRFLVVHNIGSGQVLADCLFEYAIIGHYQYFK